MKLNKKRVLNLIHNSVADDVLESFIHWAAPQAKNDINSESWLKDKPKALLGIATGLGKTIIAIKTFKPNERILVICPNSLKINWKGEIEKWCGFPVKIKVIKKRTAEARPSILFI